MTELAAFGASLEAARERLVLRSIENLNAEVLERLPNVEESVDPLVADIAQALATGSLTAIHRWVRAQATETGRSTILEILSATCFAISLEADPFATDRRAVLTFFDRIQTEAATMLATLGKAPSELLASSDAMAALLAALDARDGATCCHSRATGEWARRLTEAMRLPAAQADVIVSAAVLHDVGKIATPDRVLLKESQLNEDEWAVMRLHSAQGEKILLGLPTLAHLAPLVRAHHERWDGAGYPDRLAGTQIPFESRVVSVVDAFHAMISKRPYRDAISPRKAIEILKDGRGSQWDPAIVDEMVDMVENRGRRSRDIQQANTA